MPLPTVEEHYIDILLTAIKSCSVWSLSSYVMVL